MTLLCHMLLSHFTHKRWGLTLVTCPSKGVTKGLDSLTTQRVVTGSVESRGPASDIVSVDMAPLLGSKLKLIYSGPATRWSLISLNILSAYSLRGNWTKVSFVNCFPLNKIKSRHVSKLWGKLLTGNPVEIVGTLQPLHCIYHIPSKTTHFKWSINLLIQLTDTHEIETSMEFPSL